MALHSRWPLLVFGDFRKTQHYISHQTIFRVRLYLFRIRLCFAQAVATKKTRHNRSSYLNSSLITPHSSLWTPSLRFRQTGLKTLCMPSPLAVQLVGKVAERRRKFGSIVAHLFLLRGASVSGKNSTYASARRFGGLGVLTGPR